MSNVLRNVPESRDHAKPQSILSIGQIHAILVRFVDILANFVSVWSVWLFNFYENMFNAG